MGAEYYYNGFFSPSDNGLFARSQNWAWVAAMPSYAQAVTQLWAEVLDKGTLLEGDMPMPPVSYNLPSDIPRPISYRFWSGSQSVPIYVRSMRHAIINDSNSNNNDGYESNADYNDSHESSSADHDDHEHESSSSSSSASSADRTTMVVVGTVQPQSSIVGNTPVAVNATFNMPSSSPSPTRMSMEFRRQGSVYVIEMDGTSVTSVVQLDRWHEAHHPHWWSRDLVLEAELHDGYRPGTTARSSSSITAGTSVSATASTTLEPSSVAIFSERTNARTGDANTTAPTAAAADSASDWTSFVSFVRLCSSTEHSTSGHRGSVHYTVRPRCQGGGRCSFTPRLKLRGIGCVSILVRTAPNTTTNPNTTTTTTTTNSATTATACSHSNDGFNWVDTANVLLGHDKPMTITLSYLERSSSSERGIARLGCLDFDQLLLEHRG
jgi:hypothetical protein